VCGNSEVLCFGVAMAAELEQFCILARTLKGRACVALIQQVLSHNKIFYFGELLALPSIQGVRSSSFFSPLLIICAA
jgi:hypothetical protein